MRLQRADIGEVNDLRAWLTTVVARICLNALRSGDSRREESLEPRLPELVLTSGDCADPEHETLLADAVGLALLVILETLCADERLAFVLHNRFAVPLEEIASIVGRSEPTVRQLASRVRRRVRSAPVEPDADLSASVRLPTHFWPQPAAAISRRCWDILHPDRVALGRRPRSPGVLDESAAPMRSPEARPPSHNWPRGAARADRRLSGLCLG